MINWILDASAVIALIRNEPGANRVVDALHMAAISAVNASEVVSILIRAGLPAAAAVTALRNLELVIVPVDEALGVRAGELFALTKSKGLSLGDRICLALAEREGLAVLTTDRAWTGLDLAIKVELIR